MSSTPNNKGGILDDDRDITERNNLNSGILNNRTNLPGDGNANISNVNYTSNDIGSEEYLKTEKAINYSRAREKAESISDTNLRETMVAAIDIGEEAECRRSLTAASLTLKGRQASDSIEGHGGPVSVGGSSKIVVGRHETLSVANTQMTDEAKTMTRDAAQTLIEFANRMTNITGNTALWTAPGAMFAHKRPWDYPESVYQAPTIDELEDTPHTHPGSSRAKKPRTQNDNPSVDLAASSPPPPRAKSKTTPMKKYIQQVTSTNASSLGSSSSNDSTCTIAQRRNNSEPSRSSRVMAKHTPNLVIRGTTSSSPAQPTAQQQQQQQLLASVAMPPPTPRPPASSATLAASSARPSAREHLRRPRNPGYAHARMDIAPSLAKKAREGPMNRSVQTPTILSTRTNERASRSTPTAGAAAAGTNVDRVNCHAAISTAVQRSVTFAATPLPNVAPYIGYASGVAAAGPSLRLGGENMTPGTEITGVLSMGPVNNAKGTPTGAHGASLTPRVTGAAAFPALFDTAATLDTAPAPGPSPAASVAVVGPSVAGGRGEDVRAVDARLLIHLAFSPGEVGASDTGGSASPFSEGNAMVPDAMLGAGSARSKLGVGSSSGSRGGGVGAALEGTASGSSGTSAREQEQCTYGVQGQAVKERTEMERGGKKRRHAGLTACIVDQGDSSSRGQGSTSRTNVSNLNEEHSSAMGMDHQAADSSSSGSSTNAMEEDGSANEATRGGRQELDCGRKKRPRR